MGLEIRREDAGVVSERVTIDRHLYLTEGQDRVVEEGDPAGRWLWAAPGHEVSRAEAERLGAVKPDPDPDPDPEPEPEPKRRTPRANKARTAAADKAEGGE